MRISTTHLTRAARGERGQVFALAAISMVALCGVAGFAIDVGVWYQGHRKQQSIADAAALAAVRNLPGNQVQATTDAQSYATKNGGSVTSGNVTYSTKYLAGDTVTVVATSTLPTYFLKVLGINSATATAKAVATAEPLQGASGGAPFGIINTEPALSGEGCPCLGVATTLDLGKVGPGGFGIINIDGSQGGTGGSTLASWILNGCPCTETAPVWLYSDPGAKFNSSAVQSAMDSSIGKTLLFPVYDQTSGNGANLEYRVIGWAAFTITAWSARGNNARISGSFTQINWNGTGSTSGSNYFGVTTSILTG